MAVWMNLDAEPTRGSRQLLADDLYVSVRVMNAISRLNLRTLGDVCDYGGRRLLREPNFGMKSLKELKHALNEHGLQLSYLGTG